MKINNFANILLLLCLFPYISLSETPFDTQPFALIFSIFLFSLFIVSSKKTLSFPFPLFLLLLVFLYSICLYFIGPNHDLNSLRSLACYASVFFITLASYKTFKYINLKIYLFSILTWFLFGITQLLFSKTFGIWFLPRMSTSITRGVTSLATEPSHYAIVCIFLLLLNEIFYKDIKYSNRLYLIIMFLLLFQIIISFSGMGLLFLMIFFFSKGFSVLIFGKGFKKLYIFFLTIIAPIFIFFSFLYIPILQNKRAGTLLRGIIESPTSLIFIDQSVFTRISNIFLSFYSFIYSFGIGLGLGTGANYAHSLIFSAKGAVNNLINIDLTNVSLGLSGRIESAWGTAVYELGIIGVLFILVFIWIICRGINKNKKMRDVYFTGGITIGFLMLTSISLAFPLFGYILGIFLYYSYIAGSSKKCYLN